MFAADVSALAASEARLGPGVPAFTVREGYRVTVAADEIGPPRFLQFMPDGTLLLSQPKEGRIQALRDLDGDGVFESRANFIEGQPGVHSMDFADGWLWVSNAPQGSVLKARDTNNDGVADEVVTVVQPGGLPKGGGHPTYGILVGPERFYVAVSDPSNMTKELESDRKTIYSFALDGSDQKVFATGIRNTETLRYRITHTGERTSEIWGADHGSDWLGRAYGDTQGDQPITDVLPPDELNHYVEGGFYGHPYLVGKRIVRPEFADREDLHELAGRTIIPAWDYGAHWAANGFTFISKETFPGHRGDLFQAFHGSWNSSRRVGYCVARVMFDPMTGKPAGLWKVVDCITPDGRSNIGRPVDVAEAPDGTLVFSCSQTQKIYRISPE